MKKSTAIFMSAAMMTSVAANNISLINSSADEVKVMPDTHFVVEPKTFLADTKNTSGPNVIPDKNLRKMINRSYGRDREANGVAVSDDELYKMNVTKEMVENLRYLSPEQCVPHNNDEEKVTVKSLSGLEHAKNLEFLSLVNQEFTDLTPIKACVKIKHLDIRNTKVTDITPIKDLTNLVVLDMRAVKCGDISALANKTNLRQLSAFACNITDISPLSSSIKLEYLELSWNNFSDLSALKNMKNLKNLSVNKYIPGFIGRENTIKYITSLEPLKDCVNLEHLDISSNKVSDLTPLKNMRNLNTLFASSNEITDLTPIKRLNIKNLNLDGNNVDMSTLKFEYNVIQAISPEDMTMNSDKDMMDKLPKKVKVIVSNKEIENDSTFIYGNKVKYVIKDEKGNVVKKPISFIGKSEKGKDVANLKSNNGFLEFTATGEDRGYVTLNIVGEDYSLVGSYKYFEKHCPVENHLKYFVKNDHSVDIDNAGGSSNMVNLKDADKDVLTIVVKDNKAKEEKTSPDSANPSGPSTSEPSTTPEETGKEETLEYGNIKDNVISFVIKDEEGNVVKGPLKFKKEASTAGEYDENITSENGIIKLALKGVSVESKIKLDDENYQMVDTIKLSEDYDRTNNNNHFKYIEKNDRRYEKGKEIILNNHVYNDTKDANILTITVKKKAAAPARTRRSLPEATATNSVNTSTTTETTTTSATETTATTTATSSSATTTTTSATMTTTSSSSTNAPTVNSAIAENTASNNQALPPKPTEKTMEVGVKWTLNNKLTDKEKGMFIFDGELDLSDEVGNKLDVKPRLVVEVAKKANTNDSNTDSTTSSSTKSNTTNKQANINREYIKIAGNDRVDTSIKLSQKYYDKADTVILVSGSNYPDALVSSSLSSIKKAPIILLGNGKLTDNVTKEIERLGAKNIYIIGGANSVDTAVEKTLGDKYTTKRISGKDRYETSKLIYDEVVGNNGDKARALLTSGQNFADALSAGTISTAEKMPILLSRSNSIDESIKNIIDKNVDKLIVVGGENSINNNVVEKKNMVRLSGKDRYQTSVEVAKYQHPNINKAIVASGQGYADALTAGGALHMEKAPLILVKKNIHNIDDKYVDSISKVISIGGIID